MMISTDWVRWGWAFALLLAYGVVCLGVFWRARRQAQKPQQRQGSLAAGTLGSTSVFVVYASQTGQAENLAWRTGDMLHLAGQAVQVLPLDLLPCKTLTSESIVFLIVSTYGEGDPPDNAALFAAQMSQADVSLPAGLKYGVLALGDRRYQHFCGFGRAVDAWLLQQKGQPLFERLDIDQMDEQAIGRWFERVGHWAGGGPLAWPEWQAPAFDETGWRLADRQCLNHGSPGEAVYHLELEPLRPGLLSWSAGDIAQIFPPHAGQHRDYSIASIAADGRLHLLVRIRRTETGGLGVASGWLCQTAAIGTLVPLRIRTHKGFQQGENAHRPLILIGNGTGIAGLRAHLRERAQAFESGRTPSCWLLFGERMPEVDQHYATELHQWQASGVLARLDTVFSRGGGGLRYVQDQLLQCEDVLRQWVQNGAAIYVCGSLMGMAAGVDAALRQALGSACLEALSREGRYRRDVY